jgi:hypothetical protein
MEIGHEAESMFKYDDDFTRRLYTCVCCAQNSVKVVCLIISIGQFFFLHMFFVSMPNVSMVVIGLCLMENDLI